MSWFIDLYLPTEHSGSVLFYSILYLKNQNTMNLILPKLGRHEHWHLWVC